jgi:hypothetical protein
MELYHRVHLWCHGASPTTRGVVPAALPLVVATRHGLSQPSAVAAARAREARGEENWVVEEVIGGDGVARRQWSWSAANEGVVVCRGG